MYMSPAMTQPAIQPGEDQETMVLRTVYLPASLDEELKKLAFFGSTSKGALIRKALRRMVAETAQADPATRATRADARTDED